MHSVSDLTTSSRKTSGTVPPKLVGASTTVVGDKMYLFGGRLVAERRMVSDLYVFDLETFVWAKVPPHPSDDVPGARYFHSADSWQNYLIIFGGMGHKPDAASSDDLVVLNDVRFFDISTYRWLPAEQPHSPASDSVGGVDPIDPVTTVNDPASSSSATNRNEIVVPRARYAHLSAVSASRLYIIGGQDLQNAWLDDICVYDLRMHRWTARRPYPRHAGTYRSVAVAAQLRVRDPSRDDSSAFGSGGPGDRTASNVASALGPLGGRFNVDKRPPSGKGEYTPSENLVHLPYSADATDDLPNDIFLYSNYNFTDVKRELEVFSPKAGPGSVPEFDVTDRSASMTGTVLPPGLRFPTGAICGNHLIFAGTYLAHSYQSYSIWSLDLTTMAWSRLDPGAALSSGSWFRAALWNSPAKGTNSLLIFGNRQGSLVEDYNRRLLAWDDVAVLDLEAFGIYQPPPRQLDERSQELGLAALEEGLFADFEVVCDDGRRIACSRRLLESRWPWFRDQRRLLRDQATRAISASQELSASANAAPPLPPEGELIAPPLPLYANQQSQNDPRPDPRMTPRALLLGEPYAIAMALLQYFYTISLLTPLQHAPAVLSQLLLLASAYNLPHLQRLVRHAMHRALAPATSVGVYEVATLCGCQSLQIRALKAVMASSRRNTGRARGTSNAGGGGGGPGGGPGGGGGGPTGRDRSNSDLQNAAARARGMSDLRGLNYSPYSGSGSGGGIVRADISAEVGRVAIGAGAGVEPKGNNSTGLRTNGVHSVPISTRGRPAKSASKSEAMWPEDVQSDTDVEFDGASESGRQSEGESELSEREMEGSSVSSGSNYSVRTRGELEGRDDIHRSETATPTAGLRIPALAATSPKTILTSFKRSARIKHSVNLSMDSIYMALQAADGGNNSSDDADAEVDGGAITDATDATDTSASQSPESSIAPHLPPLLVSIPAVPLPLSPRMPRPTSPSMLSPVPRSPHMDIEDELKQEQEQEQGRETGKEKQLQERQERRNDYRPSVEVEAETASVKSTLSRVRRRKYTALADLAISQFPMPQLDNQLQRLSASSPSIISSVSPSPRSSLLVSSASMYASRASPSPSPSPSQDSADAATPLPYTPREHNLGLGFARQNGLTPDGSDSAAGGSRSASTSTSSRSARPSPLTPDSPPLPTPGGYQHHIPKNNDDVVSISMSSKHMSVSSIGISEEEALYESRQRNADKFHAFSSSSPLSSLRSPAIAPAIMNAAASQDSHMSGSTIQSMTSNNSLVSISTTAFGSKQGQVNGYGSSRTLVARTDGYGTNGHGHGNGHEHGQFVHVVEPDSDGQIGWADLRTPRNVPGMPGMLPTEPKSPPQRQQQGQQGKQSLHYPSPPISAPPITTEPRVPPPPSPNSMSFAANVKKSFSTERSTSNGGDGWSPSPTRGGFLSKARIKSKKKGQSGPNSPSPSGSPLSPVFGNIGNIGGGGGGHTPSINGSVDGTASIISGWSDARDIRKAAKAEEKKRKKAEEKARLEALAAQFSQQRSKSGNGAQKDGVSVVSTNSSERRRAANEWVEDSSGMYGGGGVAIWGGL